MLHVPSLRETLQMSSLTCTKLTLLAIAGVLIQSIGLSLFVFGFFPVKPTLSGYSGPESFRKPTCNGIQNQSDGVMSPNQLRLLYQEISGIRPSFDRLVLMVIDGLPAEFVLGKNGQPPSRVFMEAMPYTQLLLANGMAIGYHAKAAPPTVTMPRLKAMVSGAIGGFLDVAFNFNTQAFLDDNLLGQFFKIGWKMVMLGDDTWLRLFPGLFMRQDGVSSFFVKDTVQVDQNVSRHLADELSRDDWNILILHYLGLDHVGHIGGRNSVLMAPKLSELDEVVKMIHMGIIHNLENDQGRTLLVVVSDHGMTENGNHGGSSYEETDSLALFIGLRGHVTDHSLSNSNIVSQVDIAPTIALLFGVPIPKNNVGVLISEAFDSWTDDQKLRALELNSWQLFRLLQAQLPGLPSGDFACDAFSGDRGSTISGCNGKKEQMFCCLYLKASTLHNAWKSRAVSRSYSSQSYSDITAQYHEFLKTASEWLLHRATDKPVDLLAFGVTAMIMSSLILLSLVFHTHKELQLGKKQGHFDSNDNMHPFNLYEAFVLGVIVIVVLSMGSSSMIEEEHYIWHFMTSTINLLFLREKIQFLLSNKIHNFLSLFKGQNKAFGLQMSSIFILLFSGRILRGWHQGGVNWTSLPDISKWLEQAGGDYIKAIQLISGLLIICLGLFVLSLIGWKRKIVLMVGSSFLISGLLVLQHIMKYQGIFASSSGDATLSVQIIYASLGIATAVILVALPWIVPICCPEMCSKYIYCMLTSVPVEIQNKFPTAELKYSLYVIGWGYIFSWCLLQLLLQQPINSVPLLLLLVQILASILTFAVSGQHHNWLVEVAALYYLGMTGHFALGNSNTLATIDVAGAFIGISTHSTLLSGMLMFIITYASPMLFLLSMVMYISVKSTNYPPLTKTSDSGIFLKNMLGFPCLIPLSVNSVLLTTYTIVLLLMRNHLFVWSVFSPKYLYVCAATVCVYAGVAVVAATVFYTYVVLAIRKNMKNSFSNAK